MGMRADDVHAVGRGLRVVGLLLIGVRAVDALLNGLLYAGSPYMRGITRLRLYGDIRGMVGGALILIAGNAISTRKEWGRVVARNVVLVSSLFGLSTVTLAISSGGDTQAISSAAGWYVALAMIWFWLHRPHIQSQFQADGNDAQAPWTRRLAPIALVIAGIVAVGTWDVEVRTRALESNRSAGSSAGAGVSAEQ